MGQMKRLILILILLSSHLLAEETDANNAVEETKSWKGDVQFGYVATSGNTETTNLNGKFNIEKNYEQWIHKFSAVAFSTSDNEQTTAERYKLEYQADRKYSDSSYFFLNTTYEEDKFSGYDYRSTITAGYGKQLYSANKMTFDTEIGAGHRQSQQNPDPVTGNSIDESEGMVRIAAKYLWQIEEKRSLNVDLTVDVGEETTITDFEIAFVTMIAGDLSLKAGYLAKHTSEVPVGKEKLDTVVALNLLYAF